MLYLAWGKSAAVIMCFSFRACCPRHWPNSLRWVFECKTHAYTPSAGGGEKQQKTSLPASHQGLKVFSWPLEELHSFPIKSCLNLMIFTHRHYGDRKPDYVSGVIKLDMPLFLLQAWPVESWKQTLKIWLYVRVLVRWGSEELRSLYALWLYY